MGVGFALVVGGNQVGAGLMHLQGKVGAVSQALRGLPNKSGGCAVCMPLCVAAVQLSATSYQKVVVLLVVEA